MSIRAEERAGILIIGIASIWGFHTAMTRFSAGGDLQLPQVQLEIVAIGVLVWFHAKWRRSITAK